MILCIAEKPSVAKDIANVLGANSKKDGYFEGNGYFVSYVFGHLVELQEPEFYNPAWKKWSIEHLPMIPIKFETRLKNDAGVKKQFKIIQNLLHKSKEVINCGDAGQEGELIQRWVLKKAQCTLPTKRLWISSLTKETIKEGFQNLKDQNAYENLYKAAISRAISDWLLGMNATRAYTLQVGQGTLLTIGRVQTPTLALIAKRQLEIKYFKSTPYWNISTIYKDTKFEYRKGKFENEKEAKKLFDFIQNHELEITLQKEQKSKEFAPKLFDLTSLQIEASNKFAFSADETLATLQKLYEKKLVTYPRVDTQYLSEDMFPKVGDILRKLTPLKKQIDPINIKQIKKDSRYFNDKKISDHHAIIPTGNYSSSLSPKEQYIYELISLRFIAIFYPPCLVSKTTVLALINEEEFKTNGKQILVPAWRSLYPKTKNKNSKEQILPNFIVHEKGSHQAQIEKKLTQPPKHFNDATLLKEMETAGKKVEDENLKEVLKENGIGRPSTRAAIINTLLNRKYIQRIKKKELHATDLGIRLIQSIPNETLKSAELTGLWEKKLREIEKGTLTVRNFLKELETFLNQIISEVSQNQDSSLQKKEYKTLGTCPKCQAGKVIEGKKAFGCNRYKEGCDFTIWKSIAKKSIPQAEILKLLEFKSSNLIKGFKSKAGKSFSAHLIINPDFKVEFKF